MKQERLTAPDFSLDTVKERFEYWRATRPKRERIPATLWEAAVRLTRDYAISRVAKTLRLSYTDLKRRVKNKISAKTPAVKADAFAEFIELEMPFPPEVPGSAGSVSWKWKTAKASGCGCVLRVACPLICLSWARRFWGGIHDSDYPSHADTGSGRAR